MALLIDGMYRVGNLPKAPKPASPPPVDASDRKFYIHEAERSGDRTVLRDFDAALDAQRAAKPPAPVDSGGDRPTESLSDRQRTIDTIATASPYAAQAMQAELHADVEEAQDRFVELGRTERMLGTSGGYVTDALRAERDELGADLSAYYLRTNTTSTDGVDVGAEAADDQSASDHTYVVSTRSFAPHESFGAGFQGDNRGFSTDPDVTSRIHSQITFDTEDPGSVMTSAESDPSVHHLTPFLRPQETPSVDLLQAGYGWQEGVDRSTINFTTQHSGKDAYGEYLGFGFGNPAPAIDVYTDLQIVDDRHDRTLTITGELTGDDFPATESFITDPSGQSVFLATGGPPPVATPFINLIGNNDRHIADVSVTINTDDDGNFLSVVDGDTTYSIDAWNRRFTAQQPDFTEPPGVAGLNGATLEVRESYGEVGGAVSEGWNEIRDADGVLATGAEVVEAGADLAGEVVEAGVSVPAAQLLGDAEAVADIADAVLPGDGIPFVDLGLPEKPGWWPGG